MRVSWLCLGLVLFGCDDGGSDPAPPVADRGMPDMDPGDTELPADGGPVVDMGEVGVGELSVETLSLDFGTRGVGERSDRDLVLRNVGDGPLTVTGLEGLEGPFSASRQPPIRIPADAERTLVVQFSPDAVGPAMGTLRIVTDVEGATPIEVQMRGAGGTPEGMLATALVDFGEIAPGDQTADFIRVTNLSEGIPLSILAVAGIEAPFSIPEGQLPAFADPGMDAEVLVQFAPEADGDFEQLVSVETDGGTFEATLRGRALSVGDLVVRSAEPAWAPVDVATGITVHGGPFPAAPTRILVGETELEGVERVDADRVRGTLPAGGVAMATDADLLDVRVELGGQFGVLTRGFVRTRPVQDGRLLDQAALGEVISPAGNPWTLGIDTIPAELEVQIAPGTVILADGRTLTVEGVLRTGGDPGINVFSTSDRVPGAWGGIRFAPNDVSSSLNDTVIEYAGAEGAPAVRSAQSAAFVRLDVRQSAGPGVEVEAGGVLTLLGARFTDIDGDAIRIMDPTASWFRVSDTYVRRAQWPLAALATLFGNRPLGPGHDWAGNTEAGIGIGGDIAGAASLANQPQPLFYSLRTPITVREGGSLSLAAAAPLRIDGALTIEGRLVLPGGVRVRGADGGRLTIAATGTLVATGTPNDPVTFEARAPDADPQPGAWAGITIAAGATVEATRLIVRDAGSDGPALDFEGAAGVINGVRVEDSAGVGLRLAGAAQLMTVELRDNPGGTVVAGGAGSLTGISADPAPAVRFDDPALCAQWDLAALEGGDGQPATTNCP